MLTLEQIKERFEEVKKYRDNDQRNKSLSWLMTQLEKEPFKVPVMMFEVNDKNRNSEEFKLYLEIEKERRF